MTEPPKAPKLDQSQLPSVAAHAPPSQPQVRSMGGGAIELAALASLQLAVGFDTAIDGLCVHGVRITTLRLSVDDPSARRRLARLLGDAAIALERG